METETVSEKAISKINKFYLLATILGVTGIALNVIYKAMLVPAENPLLCEWLIAILVTIYYVVYLFQYEYKKAAIQEEKFLTYAATTFIYIYIIFSGLGKFYIEKGSNITLSEIIFLLLLSTLIFIPAIAGEKIAALHKKK